MSRRPRTVLFILAFLFAAATGRAQQPSNAPPASAAGTVSGRVLTSSGQPAADAHVELVELGRRV